MSLLEDHVTETERLIKEEAIKIRKEIDAVALAIADKDVRDEYYSFSGDDVWKMEEYFPQLHRASGLISIMSTIDAGLLDVCRYLALKKNVPQTLTRNRRGSDVWGAKEFLNDRLGVRNVWGDASWEAIRFGIMIRNALVHESGVVTKDELKEYISRTAGLAIDAATGKVVFEEGYLPRLLGTVKQFFSSVMEEAALAQP